MLMTISELIKRVGGTGVAFSPKRRSNQTRILTVSFDDSTTFVAKNFERVVSRIPGVLCYNALLVTRANREFANGIVEGGFFDVAATSQSLCDETMLENFDAVFFAKVPSGFVKLCRERQILNRPARPLFIGAFPGLEFTPERGFKNRLLCDIILFSTTSDRAAFKNMYGEFADDKVLMVGNPTILARYLDRRNAPETSVKDVVFLTQNITPNGLGPRLSLLKHLSSQSEDNRIVIKARQKKGGTTGHVHKELFPYQSIAKLEDISVETIEASMEEALQSHGRFISCSSTGVLEAGAMGKKVGFIDTFEGWERDWVHVASLGYSTRYNLGFDVKRPVSLHSLGERCLDEFALRDDNELLSLAEIIQTFPRGKLQTSRRWRVSRTKHVSRSVAIRAYMDAGNRHMALFQYLRGLVDGALPVPTADFWDSFLGDTADPVGFRKKYIDPVLVANTSGVTRPALLHWFMENNHKAVSLGRGLLGG